MGGRTVMGRKHYPECDFPFKECTCPKQEPDETELALMAELKVKFAEAQEILNKIKAHREAIDAGSEARF